MKRSFQNSHGDSPERTRQNAERLKEIRQEIDGIESKDRWTEADRDRWRDLQNQLVKVNHD